MSLKRSRIIAVIGTFILSFVVHFGYNILPNAVTSIFFPVNESVWEHMKMLYTTILLYGVIDYFLMKKYDISHNNFFLNLFVISYTSIIVYLAIFLPIYYKIGENMIVSISVMLITYIIIYIMSYYILRMKNKGLNYLWILFIIFGYIVLGYLTYNPIKSQLFFDTRDEIYGIEK